MFSNPLKIAGLVAGVVGGLALAAALFAGVRAFNHMRADAAAYADCRAIAGDSKKAPSSPPKCAAAIGDQLAIAARAQACDLNLPKGEAGAFAVQAACSAPVKRLAADRDAARADLVQRDQLVDQLKAERSADVARAEARGLTQAKRTADATRALSTAPRDPDGRVRCDADCLSVLAGDVP